MLRATFIGSNNNFDRILVHWLSRRTHLVGVVWTNLTAWQTNRRSRLRFVRRRMRRYGLVKVIDEALFYFYTQKFLLKHDISALQLQIIDPYRAQHGNSRCTADSILTEDVNSQEVLDFLAKRQPDIVFAMCINSYFGKKLRAIPKLGVFLWHEGITPEFKGLYSQFWAIHNLDFERIGYTLLRMNDEYDSGEVFVQGRTQDIDPFRHNHPYIGHKAVIDSLPAVERFLIELEEGKARPIDRSDAVPHYYTYPGISDLIRQRLRLRRLARR